MKTKKAFLLIVLILLFAVGAVFAGGAGESTQSEKVNLYFLKHNHPPADAFIPLLVEEYKIKNPGVESIKIESLPDTEYIVKLLTAIASGSGPDLFDLSDGFVPDFRNKKLFAAFDTAAIGAKDQAEYLDKWLPTSLDAWMTSDGKVGGLPFEFNSGQLFINVKHFKEAGLDPEKDLPKTWDELVQVAKKLTKYDKNGNIVREGFDFPFNLAPGWYSLWLEPIIAQNGGSILTADGKKAAINSPAGVKAFKFWNDMVHTYKVSSPALGISNQPSPNQDFADETTSMWMCGPWGINTLMNSPVWKNFKVVEVPQDNPSHPICMTSAQAWFVSSASKKQAEASKFIDFCSNQQPRWLQNAGYVIPRKGWFETPEAKNFPFLDVFLDGMSHGQPRVRTDKYNEVLRPLMLNLQKVVTGEYTPEKAAAECEADINKIVAGK